MNTMQLLQTLSRTYPIEVSFLMVIHSYGKWVTPSTLGVNKLVSKQYLPGAHAYRVKPEAAKVLLETAKTHAGPTDLFIRNELFDFVEEYYPWPVVVRESFSTIQNENGCQAKHGYGEGYRLL